MATAPDEVIIEIDLSKFYVGEDGDFRDYTARLAAGRIIESGGELYSSIAERVRGITEDEIREQVRPLIAEALAKAVQPTDAFGESKGEPRTLREVIVERAVKLLKQGERDFGRDKGSLADQIIRAEVERTFRSELQEAIKEEKAKVERAVREQGAEVIGETIRRVAGAL